MIFLLEDKSIVENLTQGVLDGTDPVTLLEDYTTLKKEMGQHENFFIIINSVTYELLTMVGSFLRVEFHALPQTILNFGAKENVTEITREQLDLVILNCSQNQEENALKNNSLENREEVAKRTPLLKDNTEDVVDKSKAFKRAKTPTRTAETIGETQEEEWEE